MASTEPSFARVIDRQRNLFSRAESEAVKALARLNLFREIDPRLLAPNAYFASAKFLPVDALAERIRGQVQPEIIQRLDWRRRDRMEIPAVDLLIAAGKYTRPATLATLYESGQLAAFLEAYPYKLLVLTGTGLVNERGGFRHLVIDFIQPVSEFDCEDPNETGPILRAVDTDIDGLHTNYYSLALFVGSRTPPARRLSP